MRIISTLLVYLGFWHALSVYLAMHAELSAIATRSRRTRFLAAVDDAGGHYNWVAVRLAGGVRRKLARLAPRVHQNLRRFGAQAVPAVESDRTVHWRAGPQYDWSTAPSSRSRHRSNSAAISNRLTTSARGLLKYSISRKCAWDTTTSATRRSSWSATSKWGWWSQTVLRRSSALCMLIKHRASVTA